MNTPLTWRKSSRSGGSGGQCVEIARALDTVVVRDSKNADGPVLAFGRAAFGRMAREIRAGRHDL